MLIFLELGYIIQFPNMEGQPPVCCPRQFYTGADKSLARPYSDQDLQHFTKTYGVQTTGTYSCCFYAVSLGIVLQVLVAVTCFIPGSG